MGKKPPLPPKHYNQPPRVGIVKRVRNTRKNYRANMGTFGPASPVRRIDPKDWKPS